LRKKICVTRRVVETVVLTEITGWCTALGEAGRDQTGSKVERINVEQQENKSFSEPGENKVC